MSRRIKRSKTIPTKMETPPPAPSHIAVTSPCMGNTPLTGVTLRAIGMLRISSAPTAMIAAASFCTQFNFVHNVEDTGG